MVRRRELRQTCEAWVMAALKYCADRRGFSQGHFHIDLDLAFTSYGQRRPSTIDSCFGPKRWSCGELLRRRQCSMSSRGIRSSAPGFWVSFPLATTRGRLAPSLWEFNLAGHWLSTLLARYFANATTSTVLTRRQLIRLRSTTSTPSLSRSSMGRKPSPSSGSYQFRNLKTAVESVDVSDRIAVPATKFDERGKAGCQGELLSGREGRQDCSKCSTIQPLGCEKRDLDNVPEVFLEISGDQGRCQWRRRLKRTRRSSC